MVTVDMEDHTTTDATLATVGALRADFPWVGAVLQSQLRRTEGDCRELAGPGSRVRLCKGAYDEPESVAFTERRGTSTASYVRCLKILFSGSGGRRWSPRTTRGWSTIAPLPSAATATFELQMLYGVRPDAQVELAAAGERMRVYVPYGTQWYGYFMRRLAERPANVAFFLAPGHSRLTSPGEFGRGEDGGMSEVGLSAGVPAPQADRGHRGRERGRRPRTHARPVAAHRHRRRRHHRRGIFTLAGTVANEKAGPAVCISFLIAGVASAAAAFSYAEFAGLIPKAGSAYTYGYAVLGELAGWFIGWDLLLEYTAIVAVVAIGISGYFGFLLGALGVELPRLDARRAGHAGEGPGHRVDLFAVVLCLLIAFLLTRASRTPPGSRRRGGAEGRWSSCW